ncbi:Sec-independent protein translocase protein TatB [Cocleimonas sp. KMM 6892]|uniref:Sec-independent protein translocase protein TatB n=1 Tax=unclassified Cocleimonas TaxID=2639732 RepID=UPI002DBEC365|nr:MULTISPECIES: Sec-independent protein translocase protein TatB [unclassified Cocleimonas]MEB8430899.1 Sec-independent protein translocase protein TatB [Cocleimonas sp. KMM 6892]MEC4714329.1 Sec-independent protein translocase protein TatB [Cocleimonas sp. KMM 6895]MEC4743660.1 Sec-independent protein translocase protein TatB [Cocleimonas sp. KMM 6896]
MFDSGFLEMLVIGVIALLVVGPERLPGLASKVGKFVGKMKAFIANTREDIEKEIRADEMQSMLAQQKEEISELRDMMKNTSNEVSSEVNEAAEMLGDSINEAEKASSTSSK